MLVCAGPEIEPYTAMDADGDFVVAWHGSGPEDGQGVYARLYDSSLCR